MKELSNFNIDIHGLEERSYEFDYELGPSFFQQMPQDIIEQGHFNVHLQLEKSSTMIRLLFSIKGNAELICDRSLAPFEESIETENRLILKFGDHDEDLTEEISVLNRTTPRINVAGYIFEFIALALPFKKIHPELRSGESDEDDDSENPGAIVYRSEEKESATETDALPTDPRWDALRKLKP